MEYSHIIQKKGLLKSFTVAKLVLESDIQALRNYVKAKVSSPEEFELEFKKAFENLANMRDPKNPIPGILYLDEKNARGKKMLKIIRSEVIQLKKLNLSKNELCFYINGLVNSLELTQDDFENINFEEFEF